MVRNVVETIVRNVVDETIVVRNVIEEIVV